MLTLLVAAQPLTALARTTRLRPMPSSQTKVAESARATSPVATPAPESLDSQRSALLLDLYKQMLAGAPFSEEETVILNRYAASLGVNDLEADVVISRALYASYVGHTELTKTQRELLEQYTSFVSRRMHDIADLKAQIVADDRRAEKAAGPRAPQAPPANDTCAGAETIPAAGPFPYLTAVTADITDATTTGDPNIPSCAFQGGPVSRSIWYTFTPSTSASYTFSTCADAPTGSTVDDTVLAVYTSTGGCAGPFTEIACDDDSCTTESLQSVVASSLTASTTYYVVVWKYDTPAPTVGNTAVQLRVTQAFLPANDTCAGAIALSLNTPVAGSINSLAANDYQLSGAACFTGLNQTSSTAAGRDVVYTFMAPSAGAYSFRVYNYNGSGNTVLYVASSCPVGAAPQTVTSCLGAANRNTNISGAAEEVYNLTLTSGQLVYVFVDETTASAGGTFMVEVNTTTTEVEPNDTPATAGPLSCGVEGSITPATEADFFSLGTPAVGSRVFAIIDGAAGNTSDFDMRVTTATDTLEYDDTDNDTRFGSIAPNVAGTPLTGVASCLRVNRFNGSSTAEPYRLYSVVQPPIASATAEAEPNDTTATATSATNNYFSGSLGGTAPSTDADVYATPATAGDLIVLGLDGDPTRDNTPINGKLELLDSTGTVLVLVNDTNATSVTTSGAGSLTAGTPNSPAEALTYRVTSTGTYYVRVTIGTTSTTSTGAGDYLLSISKNCVIGGGGGAACSLTCPGNVTVSNDSNTCGAVVTYAPPTTTGSCGTVTCAPASGSTFAVGTTTVTCTSSTGPTCSFTVTVNDTQLPTVTCPANMTTTATGPSGAVVTYTPPTAADNCSGATVACAPASGSTFAVGTTTVSCTATDASTNSAACTFTITVNPAVASERDTPGVYNPATNAWFLRNSNSSGVADISYIYGGAPNYVAIKGDWDNDGVDTPGLYDPATGAFFLRNSNDGGPADITFTFGGGGLGYVPIAGDWDNLNGDSVGLYNPATGVFFLRNTNDSGPANITFQFGGGGVGYIPIAGDWDGTAGDSVGLYNPTTGVFFLTNTNTAGNATFTFQFGGANLGYLPLAGDWNGDGIDGVGIYLPSSGAFFLTNTSPSNTADYTFVYGPPNYKPLGGNWDGL